MKGFRGQVTPISAIIMAGIIIALIALALVWGVPLVEKNTAITDFGTAEDFIIRADAAITDLANAGSGRREVAIPTGLVRVIPKNAADNDNNSVVLEVFTRQRLLYNESPLYLGGAGFADAVKEVGVFGESKSSVISLASQTLAEGYVLKMKLRERELDTVTTPRKGFVIAINDGGETVTGTRKLILSYDTSKANPEVKAGAAANGGDLVVTHIKVDVE